GDGAAVQRDGIAGQADDTPQQCVAGIGGIIYDNHVSAFRRAEEISYAIDQDGLPILQAVLPAVIVGLIGLHSKMDNQEKKQHQGNSNQLYNFTQQMRTLQGILPLFLALNL